MMSDRHRAKCMRRWWGAQARRITDKVNAAGHLLSWREEADGIRFYRRHESFRISLPAAHDLEEQDRCAERLIFAFDHASIRGTRVPLGKHPHEFMSEGEEFEAADIRGCYAQAERRAEDLARIFGVPVRAFEAGDRTAFYTTTSEEEAS